MKSDAEIQALLEQMIRTLEECQRLIQEIREENRKLQEQC